jgi:Undecaprenyl-phosphate glucose phosphotransferase
MLKEKRRAFEILFLVADLVVVTLAWFVSYWLRFQTDLVEVDKGIPELSNYASMTIVIWFIWGSVFRRIGLYQPMRGSRQAKEYLRLFHGNALALLLFISFTFLVREKSIPFSRLVFVYFGLFSFIFTVLERSVLRRILKEIRRRGYNVRYMLIVGAGKVAEDVALRVRTHADMGFQLVGCLSADGKGLQAHPGLTVVGSYKDLKAIIKEREIDQVIMALPLEDNKELPHLLGELRDSTIDVKIIPDLYQFISVGGSIDDFEGLPIINLQESPLEGVQLVSKRILDIMLSALSLMLLSPVFLILAVCVRLSGKGPILYKQERMSVDGSSFSILKFRTMRLDAEKAGPGWTTKNDDRVTPIGAFLRRYSLDELPQLWNVLMGDMSIVGPRPERPVFIEEFRKKIPSYMLRHKVPAGITGWAQVNGWRGDTSIDKRLEYDLYYIRNWSLFFDIKILFLTVLKTLRDKNAY